MVEPQPHSPADLAADTQVIALGAGRYAARFTPAWSFVMPSGGVVMTIALRAMVAELADDAFSPMAGTTTFCAPVPEGDAELMVTILRRGKAACQVRVTGYVAEGSVLAFETTATFVRERSGPEMIGASFPPVRGIVDSQSMDAPHPRNPHTRYPFFANLEMRLAAGPRWWFDSYPPGEARFARWFRYLKPQIDGHGNLDPLALPPIADTMPPAVIAGLGSGGPRLYAPSLDLTVHFLEPSPTEWVLVSVYARRARAGYATAEAELWSEDRRLIGFATQTMYLREHS